jgi:hypothetical protein
VHIGEGAHWGVTSGVKVLGNAYLGAVEGEDVGDDGDEGRGKDAARQPTDELDERAYDVESERREGARGARGHDGEGGGARVGEGPRSHEPLGGGGVSLEGAEERQHL